MLNLLVIKTLNDLSLHFVIKTSYDEVIVLKNTNIYIYLSYFSIPLPVNSRTTCHQHNCNDVQPCLSSDHVVLSAIVLHLEKLKCLPNSIRNK